MALATSAIAADAFLSIETKPGTKIHYPWISYLTEGPAGWPAKSEEAKVQGKSLRLVFYEGAEEMPSTYRIEEITIGDEGCCRTLLRAREFEIDERMIGVFGAIDPRDAREFEFVKWLSQSSVEFKYFGKRYVLFDLDRKVVKIRRANGS